MTAPLITVIMPAYNSVQYIEKAIKSVLNQTYSQLELLIIDDGSNDGTREIINKQRQIDERIQLNCLDNQGSGTARNEGLRRANGEYIAFIDADDYYDQNFLLQGMKLAEQGYDCIVYNYQRFNGDQETLYRVEPTPLKSYSAVWNKLYRKECWDNLSFPQNMKIEDFEVVPIAVGSAKKIGFVSDTFYYYRIHQISITHQTDINEARETVKACQLLFENMKKKTVNFPKDDLATYINNFLYSHLYTCISRLGTRNEKNIAFEIIATYSQTLNKQVFNSAKTLVASSKSKQLRNDLMTTLFSAGYFNLGLLLVNSMAKIFGKRGEK
ncbi:hypothetical protein CBF93_09390 [Limosilactobacillus reuteri]|uniref:glycosyltransferase family 2 protein n=1 Tax=Limosilactobacillus reuteri TaxID=1598 RepID=UPI000B99AB00|nr:glycosyltransferase family 2 protein [Limosilactobacillus reuteri]OYS57456.1 hypothetical protein CBF93_09390 [Limosilactobacillus reuteri]